MTLTKTQYLVMILFYVLFIPYNITLVIEKTFIGDIHLMILNSIALIINIYCFNDFLKSEVVE